ncbi:iron-containing alcohol dehydrogenase family protein [Candidatus Synechococcus calcipolaris G9]|uniref:Iron-containing alcohol dehydrogenase family protein n=1 Tax=Candidatus Synechococcus calcipolaris G9 TaxID=1497997 RepID=A0ABT6EXD7_9SYNE|nr:iron-containing alcohol dehydrogenase family protein [Candidatus Synechococcus calcipolaris]MDG2990474.1 iron-containing alcohol dehydrogenase family protein [Candidatus Synechococcus calcipolaris G9]
MSASNHSSTPTSLSPLTIAPNQVLRGWGVLPESGGSIAALGTRPLVVTSSRLRKQLASTWGAIAGEHGLNLDFADFSGECSEVSLASLKSQAKQHRADVILGVGGGKSLDTAKLLGEQTHCPVVTIPSSGATCAAWTALSNIYSPDGAFAYDVPLAHCPALLILDYQLVQTAPRRTLVAGIGDALAKWYEASISSGHSTQTLVIGAVQQARVLRDILLQKSLPALNSSDGDWQEVVDGTVLMAGLIGGLGGAQCRTVAAHAIHNGLTHLPESKQTLHGEKVAYGILVQLRLEELIQGSQLARSGRQQLCQFYQQVGLPMSLTDLGLAGVSLEGLQNVAEIACAKESDIHRLPFAVSPDQVLAAMVSTQENTLFSGAIAADGGNT